MRSEGVHAIGAAGAISAIVLAVSLGFGGAAVDAGSGANIPTDKLPPAATSPDAKVSDITPAGGQFVESAVFGNDGKVYRVKVKVRVEEVTKADGAVGTRYTEIGMEGLSPEAMAPGDPNRPGPTPEQDKEMQDIANPGPPDDPANMKAIVAANRATPEQREAMRRRLPPGVPEPAYP